MAYNYTYQQPANAGSGTQGLILPTPINFSQIFDGTPQFYVGSSIEVQEILTITSEVIPDQAHLVDVDFRWFQPKTYYGTYQLEGLLGGVEDEGAGGQGFLTNFSQKFIRRSQYQIAANPDTPVAYSDVFLVDNCNFQTKEISVFVGGATLSVNTPITNNAMFTGKISKQRAPLQDREYNQFFKSLGLYYNPGCELISVNHKVSIINTIATDLDSYPNFTCSLLGE
jgi:hypothetical protein